MFWSSEQTRVVSVYCLLLSLFYVTAFAYAQENPAAQPPVPVVVAEAKLARLAPVAWFPGTVISHDDARLAAEVAGRIKWIAKVGTVIEATDIVVRQDETLLKQELLEQEGAVGRAQARRKFFTEEVKRLRRLAKTNNAAQSQLDQAVADLGANEGDLRGAKARLERTRVQLDRMQVRAPFAGVVTQRLKREGEWADRGDGLVRVVSPGSNEIQLYVPHKFLPHVTVDAGLRFTANNTEQAGTVLSIVPVGDDRSHLYEIRLRPNEGKWYIGQTVRVAVPSATEQEVVVIERDALVIRRDGTRVFRIKDDNTAEPVTVTAGIASGSLIEVGGEIKPGDKVVTRGGERLRPGQKVQIKPQQAP